MCTTNCKVIRTSSKGKIEHGFKSKTTMQTRHYIPMHARMTDRMAMADLSPDAMADTVGYAEANGTPRISKSWLEQAHHETNITVDQEYEIKKIFNKQFAENTPILEKFVEYIVDRKLHSMNAASQSHDIQDRLEPAKKNTLPEIDIIKRLIRELFNKIEPVRTISYRQSGNKLILVIVYDNQDHESMFDQIEDELIRLENVLPEYEFEPWILHNSELEERHLHGAKTILQKPRI